MATTDRVFVSSDKNDLFMKLSKTKAKTQNKDVLFESNKDMFILAAALAFKAKKKLKLDTKKNEIQLSVFQRSKDNMDVIDLVALGDTKDVYILDWDNDEIVDKKLRIIEEYANAGLEILDSILFRGKTTLYDNLLLWITKELSDEKPPREIGELGDSVDLI